MAHYALKVEISLFNSLTKRISISQGQGPSVERMVNSEFEGCEFGGRHAPTFTRAKPKQKPGEYKVIITMAVTIILTWTFLNVDGI